MPGRVMSGHQVEIGYYGKENSNQRFQYEQLKVPLPGLIHAFLPFFFFLELARSNLSRYI